MANNSGKPWTQAEDDYLWTMLLKIEEGSVTYSYGDLAIDLGRTEWAIKCRIEKLKDQEAVKQYPINIPTTDKKEPKMKNRTVTTRTFIGDTPAEKFTNDDLLTAIEEQQAFVDRLNKLPSSSTVMKLATKHKKNIAALIGLLSEEN